MRKSLKNTIVNYSANIKNSKSKTCSKCVVNDNNYKNANTSTCNCTDSDNFPLQYYYLTSSLVYFSDISTIETRVLKFFTLEALKTRIKLNGISMY